MDRCDLCDSQRLAPVYQPGQTDQRIYVCRECGLCQSLPRFRQPEKTVAISGDANWGNIRIGKGLRVAQHLTWLKPLIQPNSVLEVGTNRGAFVRSLLKQFPHTLIDAIEPDTRLKPALQDLNLRNLWWDRIENLALAKHTYDFMYCSHTLEHLEHPSSVLCQLHEALKPDGLLFIEVPDLAFIQRPDVYEEFFIDKHRYHFSKSSLIQLLGRTGWQIEHWFADPLQENLSVLVSKGPRQVYEKSPGPEKDLFASYAQNLLDNRRTLRARVAAMPTHQRCVSFGGGRLFDIARRYGGFQPVAVVDTHLAQHLSELGGIPVHPPLDLARLNPDLVVLASRGFVSEMERIVREQLPEVAIYALFSGGNNA